MKTESVSHCCFNLQLDSGQSCPPAAPLLALDRALIAYSNTAHTVDRSDRLAQCTWPTEAMQH